MNNVIYLSALRELKALKEQKIHQDIVISLLLRLIHENCGETTMMEATKIYKEYTDATKG